MIRTLAILILLSGCATHKPPAVDCPDPPPTPKAKPIRTLEIRVELAREELQGAYERCRASLANTLKEWPK